MSSPVATRPVTQPPAALPAARPPHGDGHETWRDEPPAIPINGENAEPADQNVQNLDKTGLPEPNPAWADEELLRCCEATVGRGERAEAEGFSLLRRSLALRWRGCKAAAILRQRCRSTRDWCRVVKHALLPRSTLTEMAEVYDRAVAKGHGEAEICQYRTWTDVKIAYGVVRRKKPVAHGRDAAATPGAKSSSGNARTAASPGGGETARPEAGSRGEGRDADATTGGEEFAETEDQDEVPEVKAETLWRLLDEVTDGSFDITEAEREAFAVFVAAVGDERSARVALYHVWKVI